MDAEEGLQQLGAPGAHQPGDAEDLAATHVERDVTQGAAAPPPSGRRPRCSTRRASSLTGATSFGKSSLRLRPTIMLNQPLGWSASAIGAVPMYSPSRSTVTRSAMRKISSNLCEM